MDTSILDNIIVGRVKPHIYAFSTETIPNYLKVGDTYRPVSQRLLEWKSFYPNLRKQYEHSAMLESGNIFRDYAVHTFLMNDKGLYRLSPNDIPFGTYYSREFFKDATISDLDEAIADITNDEKNGGSKYQYYSPDRIPVHITYKQVFDFLPRENQQEAIDNFKVALQNGRNNLLMYAVMRFGKSFTAMCCATEMRARTVLIVTAKADVKTEWKRTVESHKRFADYKFFDSEQLKGDGNAISDTLSQNRCVAVFLTLQDLQGADIKEKHREIFSHGIDLLIVDETHYGARAESYGQVLRDAKLLTEAEMKRETKHDDQEDWDDGLKQLKARVKLHLSGTPYRILMGGEFTEEDIVAFCQYTDIVDAKEAWDKEHLDSKQKDFIEANGGTKGIDEIKELNEWDNPYYGFPQMIRFAFNPNKASLNRMESLRSQGFTYAFSALFRPLSIKKDSNGNHKKFQFEEEILGLLEVIDGSKTDENLLGFLDYDRIKEGKMCRHMVFVLPFRASCDALQSLIERNKDRFKNLGSYFIINKCGVEDERTYANPEDVKKKIKECERDGVRTITLTVQQMLTGTTVPEWDTMLYFKDTSSPQEYDQAIFRIQNQYIKEYSDSTGRIVKYDMKPQTLLVDFDPDRMFRMQELKSQFYNVNTEKNGNDKLEERISHELALSPIVFIENGKLKRATATNIMAVVREYSSNKSILDEAVNIPFDFKLLDNADFKKEIESLNPIDHDKGLEISPNEGDNDGDYEIPSPGQSTPSPNRDPNPSDDAEDEDDDLGKKLAAYYSRILLYAFLTDDKVKTLLGIIETITNGNHDNRRIAKALGIKVPFLNLIQTKGNGFMLEKLDYKIQNINALTHDESLLPIQRAENALRKFARFSKNEVVTPVYLIDEMLSMLPDDAIEKGTKILDIASVQGQLALVAYKKYGDIIKDSVYSVPTSSLTYELTRKIYKMLEMPLENVFDIFSMDLIDNSTSDKVKDLQTKNFDIVVGVPPQSRPQGGGRGDGGSQIYHLFFNFAKDYINPQYIAMLTKATWYTGDEDNGGLEFRNYMLTSQKIKRLIDYPDITPYVKGPTTLRGGVCLFLWSRNYSGTCSTVNRINHDEYPKERELAFSYNGFQPDFFIRWNRGLAILEKVLSRCDTFLPNDGMMYRRNPFGYPNTSDNFGVKKSKNKPVKVYLAKGKFGYTPIPQKNPNDLLNKWKVFIAKSSSGADDIPHLVISRPIVAEPMSVTANTHYAILPSESPTKEQCQNLAAYMKTKFFRFMVMLLRNNQNMTIDMYQFVPRLDFNRTWTDAQLYEKFGLDQEDILFIEMIIKEIKD